LIKKASWRQEAFYLYSKILPMTIQDINSTIEPQKKGVTTAFLVCKSKNN
jgi:hypothetical protein